MNERQTIELYKRQIKKYRKIRSAIFFLIAFIIVLAAIISMNLGGNSTAYTMLLALTAVAVFFLFIINLTVFNTKIRNRKRRISQYEDSYPYPRANTKKRHSETNGYAPYDRSSYYEQKPEPEEEYDEDEDDEEYDEGEDYEEDEDDEFDYGDDTPSKN